MNPVLKPLRSPPGSRRWRWTRPEEAGIGAVPARRAKACGVKKLGPGSERLMLPPERDGRRIVAAPQDGRWRKWAQTALRRLLWTTRPPPLGRDWAGDGHVGVRRERASDGTAGDAAMLAAARPLGSLALAGAEQASKAGRSARTRRRPRPLWLTDRQAVGSPRLRSARDRLRAVSRDRRRPGFRPVRAGTETSWGRSAVAPARDLRGAARWRRSLLRRRSRALSARPGCACSPSSGFPAPAARSGFVSRLQAADARPCAGQSACPEAVPGASGQASAR
jgi:hypothetical protein